MTICVFQHWQFTLICQLIVLVLIQHQLESPLWGVVKKDTSFSANSPIVRQSWSTTVDSGRQEKHWQRSSWFLIGQYLYKWGLQIFKFGLKATDLIGQTTTALIVWCWWDTSDVHSSDRSGKASVLLVEIQFQEIFYRVGNPLGCRQAIQCRFLPETLLEWEHLFRNGCYALFVFLKKIESSATRISP